MIPDLLPLQVTCDGVGFAEHMRNFEFIKAFTCQFASTVGFFVLGTFVFGGISLALYTRQGSPLIPFVLLLTTGGAVLAVVAPVGVQIATLLLVLTGAGAIAYLYTKFNP